MSYSEKDGQVVLTMSREDYDWILFALGALAGGRARDGADTMPIVSLLNRLNQGNPNYTPYQVGEKKS